MRLRPALLVAFVVGLAAAGRPAAAQATATQPAVARQPAMPGKPAAKPAKPAATPMAASTPAPAAAASGPVLDLNTASKADLQAVPGIGDVYSAKIIANRPYKAKDQLVSKKVLPAGVYAKVKDRFIAKQK